MKTTQEKIRELIRQAGCEFCQSFGKCKSKKRCGQFLASPRLYAEIQAKVKEVIK